MSIITSTGTRFMTLHPYISRQSLRKYPNNSYQNYRIKPDIRYTPDLVSAYIITAYGNILEIEIFTKPF
jgi:hypothetical protein